MPLGGGAFNNPWDIIATWKILEEVWIFTGILIKHAV
jgi:hypothetical protein